MRQFYNSPTFDRFLIAGIWLSLAVSMGFIAIIATGVGVGLIGLD